MTRIAILADIHGNLPALEAVMTDLAEVVAPDQIIVDGDILNRGPQSVECLRAVRAEGWPVVFGNHEEYTLRRRDNNVPEQWKTPFWEVFERVAETFTDEEIAYIRALPRCHVVRVPNLPAMRITHGSMRAINDGLGFWMSDGEMLDSMRGADEPILISAHTHRTFHRKVGNRWGVNAGSVGAPFNGDPGAQYLVMTATNGHWHLEFRSVPYDREAVYAAFAAADYYQDNMCAQVFKYEVETATFHLRSYLNFCAARDLDENAASSVEQYRAATQTIRPGRSLKA